MPKLSGPIVGISFTDDRMYAVSVRPLRGGGAQVLRIGSAPLPEGTIQNGVVYQTGMLAIALRGLLEKSRITTNNVVIGLPSRAVITRTITIPPVPDKERRGLVRSEIDLLDVLPPGQAAFDYVRLPKVESGSAKGEPILFFAAERTVVESYRTTAREAGLRVVGMEPAEFAAIRGVYPSLEDKPVSLAISVGMDHTHLLFFNTGQPVYSRRLDIGIRQMTGPTSKSPTGAPGGWEMVEGENDDLSEFASADVEQMASALFGEKALKTRNARETLAIEIARSLEYYRRQYNEEMEEPYLVLLPNNLDIAGLPVYIATSLEQDVKFVYAFEHVEPAEGLPSRFLREEGVAHAPALGLALGQVGGRFAAAPHFNLAVEEADVVRARQTPRLLAGALAASAGVLVVGAIGAFFVSRAHAPVREDLAAAQRELQSVSAQEQKLLAERQQQQDLVRQIRSQNVSWTNVLRYLAQAIPPSVGLTNVSTQGRMLTLTAQTGDDRIVSTVWGTLNNSPFFTGATLTSITSDAEKVTFQMSVNLPGPTTPIADTAAGSPQTSTSAEDNRFVR